MSQTLVEIDSETVALLNAQAAAKGMTLDDYLRSLAGGASASLVQPQSMVQFEQGLDDLLAEMPDLPALPPDFSRTDIYSDHN